MINKQTININFGQGLDTKTDPFQVKLGKFLSLQNTIFTKGGLLQKRNGYEQLAELSNNDYSYLTTFEGDLTAIGSELTAYSEPTNQWISKSIIQPVNISTLSLIKNNTNQTQCDSQIAPNGVVCLVYTDQNPNNLSQSVYKYVCADSNTGQNIIQPTVIANAAAAPRVYQLPNYFIILYPLSTDSNCLYFISISTQNTSSVNAPVKLSTASASLSIYGLSYDAAPNNGSLYVAWNNSSGGMNLAFISSNLSATVTINIDPTRQGDIVSVSSNPSQALIWIAYYANGTGLTYGLTVNLGGVILLSPQNLSTGSSVKNLSTIVDTSGSLVYFVEYANNYSYNSSIPSNYISKFSRTSAGSLIYASTLARSVGLASKPFIFGSDIYVLTVYQSPYQSTYFLIGLSGNVVAELAYQNTSGYLTNGLPSVSNLGTKYYIPYLRKDSIQSVNKNTNIPAGNQVAGIYAQTGINLAKFDLTYNYLVSAEIGSNLNINSGFLLAYDGYSLFENGFFLYPDSIEVSGSGTSGFMSAQKYFYQVTYEWSDNQGNLFRSSPSIPVSVTLSGNTSVLVNGPTLRLSLKNANNPVKIVIYRWSQAQQTYYQVTSITQPLINNPSVDQWSYTDTLADSSILGNNIIYTNGGVVENIGPPGFDSVFLFDNRLWGITSEDKNLLWFSKQILEATPVEMSDLFTIYIAPTIGAQGSTGSLSCASPMDDKLCLFKATAIYYLTGAGPDNTGANNQYSNPIFITATVGCTNQRSIIFQPQGLMFEFTSQYGNQIWLLGRDLSTNYIGAPVEEYTTKSTVESVVNVPGTNQVRFTLASGVTLTYDYYYGEWSTFNNIPAISSTLYQGVHTYINSYGQTLQESQGKYLDGDNPTLMSFTTSWINLAGLQGYQRAYFFYLLGVYLSPHKLNVQISYDYNPSIVQQTIISPNNYSPNYGSGYSYGVQSPYGGVTNLEQWKIFLTIQRCQSFQITLSEMYDSSLNVTAGGGFTLSGLNVVVGLKKGYSPTRFQIQAGGNS